MQDGVMLPGGTAPQQLEQAILAESETPGVEPAAGWVETRWELPQHDTEQISAGPPRRPA